MGKATVDISLIYLTDIFKTSNSDGYHYSITGGLPKDAELIDVELKKEVGQIRLTFESQFIEDMPKDSDIPMIMPEFHKFIKPYSWSPM